MIKFMIRIKDLDTHLDTRLDSCRRRIHPSQNKLTFQYHSCDGPLSTRQTLDKSNFPAYFYIRSQSDCRNTVLKSQIRKSYCENSTTCVEVQLLASRLTSFLVTLIYVFANGTTSIEPVITLALPTSNQILTACPFGTIV